MDTYKNPIKSYVYPSTIDQNVYYYFISYHHKIYVFMLSKFCHYKPNISDTQNKYVENEMKRYRSFDSDFAANMSSIRHINKVLNIRNGNNKKLLFAIFTTSIYSKKIDLNWCRYRYMACVKMKQYVVIATYIYWFLDEFYRYRMCNIWMYYITILSVFRFIS